VDLIVPQFEINSAKVFFPIEVIQPVINVREKVLAIYHYFIQGMTINTHP
jgi:hypothetical protein